ncbi:MAG: GNAT family N-acetyltransferase [Arachnia sp.]
MPVIIRAAINRHEQARAAAALGAAFAEDPLLAKMVPGDDRARRLSTLFDAQLRASDPAWLRVDIALDGDTVVGAALWHTPQHPRRYQRLAGLRQLPRAARAARWSGITRLLTTRNDFAEHRPLIQHWYLEDIGVPPGRQGGGLGRGLLDRGLARVDADAQIAYLEATTDSARRLYERAGFEVRGRISGYAPVRPYAMVRPARPATAG